MHRISPCCIAFHLSLLFHKRRQGKFIAMKLNPKTEEGKVFLVVRTNKTETLKSMIQIILAMFQDEVRKKKILLPICMKMFEKAF
jgi:hypothetical protein